MALIYHKNTLPKNQFFNCKATFKAAGITSKVHINERGDSVKLEHFDLINCMIICYICMIHGSVVLVQ